MEKLLHAHGWLELRGLVIADTPDEFRPTPRVR